MRSFLIAVLLVGAAVHAAPRCLSLTEARAAAGAPADFDARLTPPLPTRWPPSGAAEVRFFDFRSVALPTGIVSYGLDSPTQELTVPLDGSAARKRALGKRKRLGSFTPPLDPPPAPEAASVLLLRLVCEQRMPTDAEAAQLREGYGAWLSREPLVRNHLAPELGLFIPWLGARPSPPPAPPGASLSARVEGEAVVLSRGGVDVKLQRPGLATAQLMLVPLRADGSEPALWLNVDDPKSGPLGLLVRYANPPQVQYTHVFQSGSRGISSSYHALWIYDVDGDGWNDLLISTSTHTDVGTQPDGKQVYRFDSFLNGYFPDDALARRAPRASPDQTSQPQKLIAAALKVPEVQLRGKLDGHSVPLPSPARPESLALGLGGGGPPTVGADWLHQVLVKKKGQKFGGHAWLAHVRLGKEPALVSLVDLGEVGFPVNGCGGKSEVFRREPGAVVVVWPDDKNALVEQRVPWDGKTLSQPASPPKVVGDCSGL